MSRDNESQNDSDFEVIEDEEWEGPEPVEMPKMVWPTKQSDPIIHEHLYRNREQVQRPTQRVQEMIPNGLRKGFPFDVLRDWPNWEQEQFWIWLMPMFYTANMKQLNQYLEFLREGLFVSSYRGHLAANELYQVCKAIVRHRMRKGV